MATLCRAFEKRVTSCRGEACLALWATQGPPLRMDGVPVHLTSNARHYYRAFPIGNTNRRIVCRWHPAFGRSCSAHPVHCPDIRLLPGVSPFWFARDQDRRCAAKKGPEPTRAFSWLEVKPPSGETAVLRWIFFYNARSVLRFSNAAMKSQSRILDSSAQTAYPHSRQIESCPRARQQE